MSLFLQAVVQTFPWCLGLFVAGWALLAIVGDLRGLDLVAQLFVVLVGASGLTVFVGGAKGLRAQHADRVKTPDAAFRADRLDVGLICFFLGSLFALGAGYLAQPPGGEILGVVGGLLGFWLVSASPFSPFLIVLVLGWTLGTGLLALVVHQQPLLEVWKLLGASLSVLVAAGVLRRVAVADGPPGWLRTFVAFGTVTLTPLGFGLLTPPHEFGRTGNSLADTALPWALVVGVFLAYQWLCLSRPDSRGRPAEPTQSGCGCAYLGLGVLMVGLDQLAGNLYVLSLPVRVGLLVLAVLGCAVAASISTRQVRETYRRTKHGS